MYAWIAGNRGRSSVALCCDALKVTRAGYYAWQKKPRQGKRDEALASALKRERARHPSYGVQSLLDVLPEELKVSGSVKNFL